jgi:hypothetical protein
VTICLCDGITLARIRVGDRPDVDSAADASNYLTTLMIDSYSMQAIVEEDLPDRIA